MILGKYQLADGASINERGYSSTAIVEDEVGTTYFAKWIKGINQGSNPSKILSDKLRQLKKASHQVLPKIIEYGLDEEYTNYCIIFERKNAKSLEDCFDRIKPTQFFDGILQVLSCLQQLLQNHRITHGDITPSNILVSEDFDFYLIDFGISDIAVTLSQHKELVVFAKAFAAPEKWNREVTKGFSYQSDIFSIGKTIEWYFQQKDIEEFDVIKALIDEACKQEPQQRLNYNTFQEGLNKIKGEISFDDRNLISVSAESIFIEDLNDEDFKPYFDVSPKGGDNILINVISKKFWANCLWLLSDKKLKAIKFSLKEESQEKYDEVRKYGQRLGLPFQYKSASDVYGNEKFNLEPILKKIQREKQKEKSYKEGQREKFNELNFFKELLEKEKAVIEKNSLRVRYKKFQKESDHEISFKIENNEKFSRDGFIFNHIDKATPPTSEEFEYILSEKIDKRQQKKSYRFIGVAYDFDKDERILKFKDCENLQFDKIPANGYLFENTSKQEEEKNRQLEAIRKVRYNEVQNRDLLHAIFNPQNLKGFALPENELTKVFQTDKNGKPFVYSFNQQKAILNAIHRSPLTIIQGPPGTGKTTVITEIVFQILEKEPNAKILITSQTNSAVDNVLDNLLEKEIPFVRLSGIRQQKPSLEKHTLERKIEGWKNEVRRKAMANWKSYKNTFLQKVEKESILLPSLLKVLLDTKKEWKVKSNQLEKILNTFNQYPQLLDCLETEEQFIEALNKEVELDLEMYFTKWTIHNNWLASISSLDSKSKINQKLIDSIQVIGATTSHIAAKKYKRYNFEFDYVIMDESGKATTAESLIPIVLAEKLILVGDHRQLRPMLTADREVESWLRKEYTTKALDEYDSIDDYMNRPSLFEQIIITIDEDFKAQLDECRRCSEDQVRLTSKCFYEPFGDDPIQPVKRPQKAEHNLDLKINSSIIFFDIGNAHKSKKDANDSSYNKHSASLIRELIMKLDQDKQIQNYSLGIITGYTAQLRTIQSELRKVDFRKLKNLKQGNLVASVVDRFQGLEKDIIIVDLVRSGVETLGFLANANRINVALSRQKRLLIIVGSRDTILNAKPPKSLREKSEKIALQEYMKALKPEWIVNDINHIF